MLCLNWILVRSTFLSVTVTSQITILIVANVWELKQIVEKQKKEQQQQRKSKEEENFEAETQLRKGSSKKVRIKQMEAPDGAPTGKGGGNN